ncbi:MAG: helix-turn-helix domain-containing protein, partial [candidate division WOR-3 bacterium]
MIENPRKITKAMVEEMKRLKRQGMRGVDIARRLGVSPSTVYAYLRGRRVAPNVENPPEIALTTEALLQQALANPEIVAMLQNPRGVPTTIDQIRRIIELARAGYSDRAISKEVGLHPAHIGKIRRALGIYKRAGRGLSHPEYLYPVAMHLQRLGFSPVIQVPAGFKTTQLRKRAPRRAPAQTPAPAPTPTPTPIPIPTPVYVPAPPRGFTIAPPIQPQSNPPEFLGILGGFQEEIVSS